MLTTFQKIWGQESETATEVTLRVTKNVSILEVITKV